MRNASTPIQLAVLALAAAACSAEPSFGGGGGAASVAATGVASSSAQSGASTSGGPSTGSGDGGQGGAGAPSTGTAGAGGEGPGAGGDSPGTGGEGGAGDGGGGTSSSQGGAGGLGGAGEGGGGGGVVDTCAGFRFTPANDCDGDGSLATIRSHFDGVASPVVGQVGCAGHTTVEEASGVLSMIYPPAGVEPGDEACPAAWGASDPGSLRGCAVEVSVLTVEQSVQFLVRDFSDGDNFGTFGAHVTAGLDGPTVEVVRFGPTEADPRATTTFLGRSEGHVLPLRLFIANTDGERVCAGVESVGGYDCIGCWEGDAETTGAIDTGSMFFTASAGATLDELNFE